MAFILGIGAVVGMIGSASPPRASWTLRTSVGTVRPVADHEFTQILYDVSDQVATITLNRPEQLNAFTGTMMREMIAAFDHATPTTTSEP